MKKAIAALIGVVFSLFLVLPAHAMENQSIPVVSDCLQGWYVNPDEGGADENQGDRRPTSTEDGLVFVGNQLVHHSPGADILLGDLKPGTFVADPAPSLETFFSVEVGGPGYATLRWSPTRNMWNVGGTDIWNADPSTFVGTKNLSAESHVLSFGVGYVNTPNNGTETTVSSVTFAGNTYDLTCKPQDKPAPTETETTTPPAPDPSSSSEVPTLPVTGAPVGDVLTAGLVLVAAGIGALWYSRRRQEER